MITESKMSLSGFLTWLICTLFFLYEFLLRTILGTFQTPLMDDLQLTSMQFSLLSTTVFQLIYGIMQIPIGIIVDQIGLKKILFIALAMCAIANLGFSFSHHFITAILFRMLAGLGSSCGFICLLIAIFDWMPRKNIALFIGISQFIGTLGPMIAAGPINSLSQSAHCDWREVFFILGLIGALLSMLALLYVKNNRQQQSTFIYLSPPMSISKKLYQLIKQKQIWLIALYSACVYFSIEYLTENEGLEFLIKRGFSQKFSSYMITLAWFGYAIASPLLGFLSDKMQRRKSFIIICAFSTLISLITIIYCPLNQRILPILFVLLGMGASGSVIGFAIMAEQCAENTRGIGLGLNNTIIVLLAAINAPAMACNLSRLSNGYPLQLVNYQNTFTMLIFLAAIALSIGIFYIKETFCKSSSTNTILNTIKNKALT